MLQQEMNQTVVKAIFCELKDKIAHRTSEKFAVHILNRFLQELSGKYEFMQYIKVNQTLYTEKNDIVVDPNISNVDSNQLSSALETLIQKIVIEMKEGADYFFIKELQDALEHINKAHYFVNNFSPLESMQQEFLSQRRLSTAIPKTQLFIDVIHAVLVTVNKYHSENETLSIVHSSMNEMEKEFSFFKEVILAGSEEKEGYYTVELKSSIQSIPVYQLSKAFTLFFTLIARHCRSDDTELFRNQLKNSLGRQNLSFLNGINVSLDSIEFPTQTINEKKMFERLIISLIQIINQHTSDRFAFMVMNKLIEELKQQHLIMNTLQIEKKDGIYQISLVNEKELSDRDKLRKVMKTLIERVGKQLQHKQSSFIEQLKQNLGKDYVTAIEEVGVNFHIFELKFI